MQFNYLNDSNEPLVVAFCFVFCPKMQNEMMTLVHIWTSASSDQFHFFCSTQKCMLVQSVFDY